MVIERIEGVLLDLCGSELRDWCSHLSIRISCFMQGGQQWKLLHEIFYCKSEVTLEYEAKKLIEDSTTRSAWEDAQEKMLFNIVKYLLRYTVQAQTTATSGMSSREGFTSNRAKDICARASSVDRDGSTILTPAKNSKIFLTQR